ncbi:hypothetical protein E5163_13565 [Marinicauda algicola]|uniref:Uncharacterized protein n=1 Tax=Marinicauda algicola TaxID=2029849 RepID=A0A4S2GXZ5_9PROT|nr:hypothetical protein [Marinicauda algicola]TGY87934.1 hypothetical protein E5163_13565 [Marinicauda algicola]
MIDRFGHRVEHPRVSAQVADRRGIARGDRGPDRIRRRDDGRDAHPAARRQPAECGQFLDLPDSQLERGAAQIEQDLVDVGIFEQGSAHRRVRIVDILPVDASELSPHEPASANFEFERHDASPS